MAASAPARDAAKADPRAPNPQLVWALALAGCAAAALSVWLGLTSDEVSDPTFRVTFSTWITVPYIAAGLVAWRRRPSSRLGPLMVAAGFVNFLGTLQWASIDVVATLGQALDFLPPVVFLHVFLAFPTGRLQLPFERALVAVAYAVAVGLQLIVMVLGGTGPHNLLEVVAEPEAAGVVQMVQLVAMSAIYLTGIGVLVAGRPGGGAALRRSLALLIDSFALGLFMIAVLFLSHLLGVPWIEPIRWATFFVIGIAPVAFLVGLLDARLAHSAVGDLFIELRADPAPADLQDALARALRDPSLSLAYWLPQYGSWADLDGSPVELPAPGTRRATTLIDRDGAHVAAILHDPSLGNEPELIEAVRAAAGIALENGRLHAELRARLDELAGSRARVIEAGQNERQRLERNLHDGAQQRLIALALELGRLEERLRDDPDAKKRLDRARAEIASSLQELRDVALGLHPAVVSGHGLTVALESLAAHAAVPVQLTVDLEGRLPEPLEVAGYYVISESLANIGKHAQARSATVDVSREDGQVILEIVDDGIGGADTERGSGLRGLADRVEALGGRLRVWSPRSGGTRVKAEIPCG